MQVRRDGDPVLRVKCEPWDFSGAHGDAPQLADQMIRVAKAERGMGLSAPQVGVSRRAFVMRHLESWTGFFNPWIVWRSEGRSLEEEGCLSFPGLYIKVRRSVEITANWTSSFGVPMVGGFTGLAARCFQHELDHLDGKLFVDGRSVAVALARKRMKKAA